MPHKILVVDGKADSFNRLELIRTQAGCQRVKANNGKACLEAVAQEIPGLIGLKPKLVSVTWTVTDWLPDPQRCCRRPRLGLERLQKEV